MAEGTIKMTTPMGSQDKRSQQRVNVELPATVSIGSQLTVKGQLRDISLSSAFITMKNNVYLGINDEVGVVIQTETNEQIQALARISRIVPGEGFAFYFTKIDDVAVKSIKKILLKSGT